MVLRFFGRFIGIQFFHRIFADSGLDGKVAAVIPDRRCRNVGRDEFQFIRED